MAAVLTFVLPDLDDHGNALYLVPVVAWWTLVTFRARAMRHRAVAVLGGVQVLLLVVSLGDLPPGLTVLTTSAVAAIGEELLLRVVPMLALWSSPLALRIGVLSATGVVFIVGHGFRAGWLRVDLVVFSAVLTILAAWRTTPLLLVGLHLLSNGLWRLCEVLAVPARTYSLLDSALVLVGFGVYCLTLSPERGVSGAWTGARARQPDERLEGTGA